MTGPDERRRVIVRGRVQGVFFRASTRERAIRALVAGWVRNRRDGSVEAVFEGGRDGVEEMVAWCRSGPPGAAVTAVEISSEPVEGLSDFRIH